MSLPPPPSRTETPSAPAVPWHARETEQALAALQASLAGLSSREAAERLQQHGPNRLEMVEGPGLWRRVLAQFNNLLIMVLLAAVVVTALIGHTLDAGVILAVVLFNVLIGVLQEGKAEKALQAIRHLLAPHAMVLRDGRLKDIDAADLVPGDVV